jgi:putative transposase
VSKPPRDLIPSLQQVYFLSIGCSQGKSVFQSERMALLLLETLSGYRAQGKFQLHEFVVMPNHVHLLVTPGREVALERAVQFIKGGFSFRAGRELGFRGEIWQRGYVDHRIRDFADYVSHREYIHMNPVRAHLCESAAAFAYSSANPAHLLDAAPQGLKPI